MSVLCETRNIYSKHPGLRNTIRSLNAIVAYPKNNLLVVNTTTGLRNITATPSGVHRKFVRGRRLSTNSVEDRGQGKRGSGGGSPLVRGSGGSCNLVQEISFHIVKFS